MKRLLPLLFLCTILAACSTSEKKEHTDTTNQESTTEVQEKKLPRAACLLWIDKNKERTLKDKVVRNVKARVHIDQLGKITVLEYEKTPHFLMERKIDQCLKTYRVTPEMMEKGRLMEGENIVFLRFVERELAD